MDFQNQSLVLGSDFQEPAKPHTEKYGISKTVKVTPTFIFVKDQTEVGRIEGYNGQELFWSQVDEIIKSNSTK